MCAKRYDSFSDVGEIRVYRRADFQSGSRVLKKVFWTLSYLYLWHTMWFHAKKLLRTLKFWKSLNSLCKSGSRPQKSPKKAQKTDHSIAIYSNFWIGMVYFGYHLVKAHVQAVQCNVWNLTAICTDILKIGDVNRTWTTSCQKILCYSLSCRATFKNRTMINGRQVWCIRIFYNT